MIRNLLATTAIATLLASGAVAHAQAPAEDPAAQAPDAQAEMVIQAEGHLASNLMGENVYNSAAEDADNIGTVNDLVLDQDGNIEAIVVGVGGFLGVGQREVALDYELVQWVERDGQRWLVVETTQEALEAEPEFDRTAFEPMPADAVTDEQDMAATPTDQQETDQETAAAPTEEQPADQETAAVPTDEQPVDEETAEAPTDERQVEEDTAAVPTDEQPVDQETAEAPTDERQVEEDTAEVPTDQQEADQETAAAPTEEQPADQETAAVPTDEQEAAQQDETVTGAIDRDTLQETGPDQIRAENLTGATVYGVNEDNIGTVGDVILTPDGEVDAVIVDVGGFLGIGTHEVAIGLDNVAFMTDQGGNLYLYTEFTQEELEAQPEFDEATYAEQRDQMRLAPR